MVTKQQLLQAGYTLTSVKKVKEPGLYLKGEFMHGDADMNTTSEMDIESIEEWQGIKEFLLWMDSMSHNANIDYRQSGMKGDDFYAKAGEIWREEYLWDGVMDWWEMDVTSGGDMYASLERYSLIYSDGENEWEVK